MFACTEEHFHVDDCPHEHVIFWGMLRDRRGHFSGSMWICDLCHHRVNATPQQRAEARDVPLFEWAESNGENHEQLPLRE